MQILEIDWQQFLEDLPGFQRLPREARLVFLERVRQGQPITNAELGEHREALLASGFLAAGVKERNASVPPRYRGFCRVMRALHRRRIFDSPSRETFHQYLAEHFTSRERGAFCRLPGGYYGYYGEGNLYSHIASVEWVRKFLAAKDASWEKQFLDDSGQQRFLPSGVFVAAQQLVRKLLSPLSPVPLLELHGLCSEARPDLLAASLAAAMRYLLLFPSLRGDDLEPVLGIWPRITERLFGVAPKRPRPTTPHQVFHAPFLMDDVASILAVCAAEPLRVRRYDFGIFARTENEIAEAIGKLPDWVEKGTQATQSGRVSQALALSKSNRFLERKGEAGQDLHLEITPLGRRWLGQPAKERLRALVDCLVDTSGKDSDEFYYQDNRFPLLPYSFGTPSAGPDTDIPSSVLTCFRDVDEFVSLQEFLAYHRERNNPLLSRERREHYGMFLVNHRYVSTQDPEELELAWSSLLADFLRLRLLPLGAAKLGLQDDGALSFALTEVGQYLVGAQKDFDLEQSSARVVVQPNFDVVFLAAAPRAESEIGRFAERKGRHIGTLFKITRRSILAAAAAGLASDDVLETLRQCCSGDIPPNVEREISGWCAQCRRVSLRRTMLIDCQDAETAVRVLGVVGQKATRLSETIIELHDSKAQPALARKLREMGVFVHS
jgi:Helicase conserved C-terminal domain